MAPAKHGIALKVRSGMLWSFVESWSVQLLQFLTFLIIARYVDAAALGIVAMALLVGQFFQNTILAGLSTPLISAGRQDRARDDTAFWISTGLGGALMLLMIALAGAAERWLGHPGLGRVLAWLSLVNLLAGINMLPQALLTRSLKMRPLALRSVASTLSGAAVGIPMAIAGHGFMALVAQNLVVALVATVILWSAMPARPHVRFDRAKATELFFYGRHVSVAGLANFFNGNSDVMVVGVVLGAAAAGVYSVGKRALLAANLLLSRAISRVALPAFSQIKEDRRRLTAAFTRMLSATSIITTPAFAGLALIADEFIHLLFGARWEGAAAVMRPLCLFGALQAVGIYNQSIMMALGKPHWQTRLALLSALANLSLFFMATGYGPAGVAEAFTLRAFILYPLSIWAVTRLLPLNWRDYWKAVQLSVVASVFMAGCVIGARALLPDMHEAARLACLVVTGVLSYGLAVALFGRSELSMMLGFARGRGAIGAAM